MDPSRLYGKKGLQEGRCVYNRDLFPSHAVYLHPISAAHESTPIKDEAGIDHHLHGNRWSQELTERVFFIRMSSESKREIFLTFTIDTSLNMPIFCSLERHPHHSGERRLFNADVLRLTVGRILSCLIYIPLKEYQGMLWDSVRGSAVLSSGISASRPHL